MNRSLSTGHPHHAPTPSPRKAATLKAFRGESARRRWALGGNRNPPEGEFSKRTLVLLGESLPTFCSADLVTPHEHEPWAKCDCWWNLSVAKRSVSRCPSGMRTNLTIAEPDHSGVGEGFHPLPPVIHPETIAFRLRMVPLYGRAQRPAPTP